MDWYDLLEIPVFFVGLFIAITSIWYLEILQAKITFGLGITLMLISFIPLIIEKRKYRKEQLKEGGEE